MKKLFSLLAVAAMAFTACQNDEGVKNSVNGEEGIVNFTVNAPELATRGLDGDGQSAFDSAYGAIDYADYSYSFLQQEYDIRWQMEIYEANALDAEPIYTERLVHATDYAPYTSFTGIRLVPGREYQFVIFADFVEEGSLEDFRYNTADLKNITADSELNAMDETYDAYFVSKTFKVEAGTVNDFEATLTRPFGKIRVLTTDADFVANYAVPAKGQVTFYNHPIYKSFNAVTGLVDTELTNEEEVVEYAIDAAYYKGTTFKGAPATTLFATYVLGKDAQETVNFRMDTFEEDGSLIKSNDFSTEIPYQRNHLTTIVGTLLTNEANVFIEIDDNFDVEHVEEGEWDNPEAELAYVREGIELASNVYDYETNLFNIRLLSDNGGQVLPVGKFEFTESNELIAAGQPLFNVWREGMSVEKGTLVIEQTRAAYALKLDIYATIDGVTENYIYEWAGELKAPRTPLAEPVVTYEVDEVEALYITFSWEAVEGAKNYTVKFLGEELTVEGTAATFDFSGEDTNATAYVTANPEFTWSNTASTGSVTVDWKKPIVYTEVPVQLYYVNEPEVAFYTEGLKIYVPNYPELTDAWYQSEGETPKVFSKDAEIEASAAEVVITEPALATKFVYTGSMEIYALTEADVTWGANAVEIAFSGDDAAITVAPAVPLEEGFYTINPSYVMVEGDTVPTNNLTATMNVILKNGVYTVFFNVAVTSSIQKAMQFVGAIDFTKPYAPDYKLTTCTAGEETINFNGDVEFEIEGTSLESGDVVVTKYVVAGTDFVAEGAKVTAVATVTEENGVYDARYVVTTDMVITTQVKNLQYVGEFKPYEAPEQPADAYEFEATYEDVEGLAVFTGVTHDYKIFVNNLASVKYDGTQSDGWGPRSLKFPGGTDFNNFKAGDELVVDGDNVKLYFVGYNGSKMCMVASTAPEVVEPEKISVELTQNGAWYEGGNYQIDYYQGAAVVYVTTVAAPNNMIDAVTVYDDADELVFEFFDNFNNVNVTAIYTKNVVTPATDIEVYMTLDNGIYMGMYETTTYMISPEDGIALAKYADGTSAPFIYEMSENTSFIIFTFTDSKNNVNVTALYQKANAPAEPEYITLTTFNNTNQKNDASDWKYEFSTEDRAHRGNLFINNGKGTSELIEGGYTWYQYGAGGILTKPYFQLHGYRMNNVIDSIVEASMEVKGNFVYLTINGINFKAEIATVEPEPEPKPEPEYTEYTETAEFKKVYGNDAYVSDSYMLTTGGEWWYIDFTEGGKYTSEKNGNVTTFKFIDEKNKRHVTITYTEQTEEPEGPVVYDPWTCTGSMEGNYLNATVVLTGTGENKDIIKVSIGQLVGNRENPVSQVTLNGETKSATGTLTVEDSGYTAIFDITVGNTTYKGQSSTGIL